MEEFEEKRERAELDRIGNLCAAGAIFTKACDSRWFSTALESLPIEGFREQLFGSQSGMI
ncbi:hypothetical protein RP319_14570 [Heyndrickxia coagulans]|uniref:hypothetical protein n=1 Tax=Heyndrickxia coagulans TaxID=1398 RepID=UPI0028FB45FB|nr:hypothetical protein [Heyndrickxia coagulans]MDT9757313.1 hypothetical protein [Heyndrickxia coagulans]